MTFDIVVFEQKELEAALHNGCRAIALCDNSFVLPLVGGISYSAIGDVQAEVNASYKAFEELGIRCDGFTPVFLGGACAKKTEGLPRTNNNLCITSASSYISSYMTSYLTSYYYEYAYRSSYSASYASSYMSSSYTTSYNTSYSTSYAALFNADMPMVYEECIMVNGYGINLI